MYYLMYETFDTAHGKVIKQWYKMYETFDTGQGKVINNGTICSVPFLYKYVLSNVWNLWHCSG